MPNVKRLKKTSQILRDVPLDIAQAYGVSKHAAETLLGTSCGIRQALELDLGARTSIVDSAAIKVLAEWDFLSYPEGYPRQSRAGVSLPGISWVPLSGRDQLGRRAG